MTDFLTNVAGEVATGAINTLLNYDMAEHNAAMNYHYGEMAAQNSDKRTRALYNDLMSPKARIQQLKAAGLSPSLYAEGAGGGTMGVTSGAQGTGASGVSTPAAQLSAPDAAAIRLANAQAGKAEAETTNINRDTDLKEIEKVMKTYEQVYAELDAHLMTTYITNNDGTNSSLFEMAENAPSYNAFLENVRKSAEKGNYPDLMTAISTERGQQTLRGIYMANERFSRDISVLGAEDVSAKFQRQISEQLADSDFAKLNADEAVTKLRASISTSELTAAQKEAWNNLLNRLGRKSETLRDVVIVISMILNNAMSNWQNTTFRAM